ncbi:transposase family protein [Streptomyces sp. NPDC002755]|uniref:transposase family protein n=1 Tax=Streptomyces sp. NPDC002884 TaxID=3154544 RepID=UPI003334A743
MRSTSRSGFWRRSCDPDACAGRFRCSRSCIACSRNVLLELFPYLSALLIEEVQRRPDKVVLRTRARATTAACRCGQSSARVHGRYVRRLRDVAVGGLGVVIELGIRRFRCENPACTAVTFAEQIAGLTTPHSRHTPQLRGVLTQIGLSLAGQEPVWRPRSASPWAGIRCCGWSGPCPSRRSARWRSSGSTTSPSARAATTARS